MLNEAGKKYDIILHRRNLTEEFVKCIGKCSLHFSFQYFRVTLPKSKTDNYPILDSLPDI